MGQASQSFYARGKLLLSGEYFVMDGALALALPARFGQSLEVSYRKSYTPCLRWRGVDINGEVWFEAAFELWQFDFFAGCKPTAENYFLQKLLRAVREENHHFLRDQETTVEVTTRLEFPLNWGLGGSSTLIYNMAQWAYTSPFALQFKTLGGSGYDIACAQAEKPILYEKSSAGPCWTPIAFSPPFADQLYFVYLGKKQSTHQAIEDYRRCRLDKAQLAVKLSGITQELSRTKSLADFEFLLLGHEKIISQSLGIARIQELYFADYWAVVKSLGAWGGDFVLVTSDRSSEETRQYFNHRGFDIFLTYREMIADQGDGGSSDECLQ